MNQIINMILRQVVSRLINVGINKGVDAMARRKGGTEELTPEQQRLAAENKKRARQAIRIGRRAGR